MNMHTPIPETEETKNGGAHCALPYTDDAAKLDHLAAFPAGERNHAPLARYSQGAIHMNSPCRFKKRDITRAVGAARAAGINVGRVDIDLETGKISIVSAATVTNDTPLDGWLAKHGASPNAS